MKQYYFNCPRGFANEFDVISVDMKNADEVEHLHDMQERYNNSSNPDWYFHRVTAKRAREIVADERRQKRRFQAAGLNNEYVGATEITTMTDFMMYSLYC